MTNISYNISVKAFTKATTFSDFRFNSFCYNVTRS